MIQQVARQICGLFLTLTLCVAGGLFASGATLAEIEAKNSIEIETHGPHTRYGRPLASGPLRVLFLMKLHSNVNVAASRDAVEMAARFDLDADVVLVMPSQGDAYAVAFPGESGVFGGEPGRSATCAAIGDALRLLRHQRK